MLLIYWCIPLVRFSWELHFRIILIFHCYPVKKEILCFAQNVSLSHNSLIVISNEVINLKLTGIVKILSDNSVIFSEN